MTKHDSSARLDRAKKSLIGLSVGDAIGEALSYQFHNCRTAGDFSHFRPGTVRYTDDTEMALAILDALKRLGRIDEDVLAWEFSRRFKKDPDRGYGKMARHILNQICQGRPWKDASTQAFGGGSYGNGAAMRVAPLGAYFADDLSMVPEQAAKSARVTHFHPEGVAGAIAVAVAAAVASHHEGNDPMEVPKLIWEAVLDLTPESIVRNRLSQASQFLTEDASMVSRELGNGSEISAQDTVPFCIWSACKYLGDFREAILSTIEVGGDCDTNCAIVGGIIGAYANPSDIPQDWLNAREAMIQ